jgi:hypothetical protein
MRYTMNDPGVPNAYGALMPTPSVRPTASTMGLIRVYGNPRLQIAAPKPAALPETAAGTRSNQPSYNSPDVIMPSVYYTTPENLHPPVGLFRSNPMPVPAAKIFSLAGVAQRMRRVGGRSQVGQPMASTSWPEWKGTHL